MKAFDIFTRRAGEVTVADLEGNLVLSSDAPAMRRQFSELLDQSSDKIVLNLTRVNHVDSTGIGMLVSAKTTALSRNMQLKICCISPLLARLLGQLQLMKVLDVHEDEARALASFQNPKAADSSSR